VWPSARAMSILALVSGCGQFGTAATTGATPDGGDGGDAGDTGDAGDAGDAAAASSAQGFCAKVLPKPAFCADFDDGVFPPVNSVLDVTSAAAMRDDTMSTSPRSSMLATVEAIDNASGRLVFTSSGAATTGATLTFMARIRSDFQGGQTQLVTLQADDANMFGVRLAFSDDGLHAVTTVGTTVHSDTFLSTFDRDQWFKITMVVRRGSADFTIAGGTLQTVTFTNDPLPAPLIMKIGLYGDGNTTAETNFDDIVLTIAP
jgi:hypothetical protein